MKKSDFVDFLANHSGESKVHAKNSLESVLDAITAALKSGNKVELTGFGTFEVRHRASRMGRNPRTGETIQIAASRSPAFKAGKKFKDSI